jgi:hypothetical protein
MSPTGRERKPADGPATDRRRVWGARACLLGGVITYLALAALALRWRPGEPFIASIFIFFAAHSAAYLVLQEVRDHRDGASSHRGS